ncbi:MAG: DMT family transporter [Erythrobacter sp.]
MNLSTDTFAALALLMFLSGIGIPIMATLNGGLGAQLGSPIAACLILLGVAAVIAGTLMLFTGGVPAAQSFTLDRPILYLGGAFFLFYILSITWAGPKMGIGNAVFFVLLGQLVAAAAIDHYGLWGAIKTEITVRRIAGIMLMAAGVYLARKTT